YQWGWNRLFGPDPAIIGKSIRIAELPVAVTIVGVASPLLQLPPNVDFWFNSRSSPRDEAHVFSVIARVKPGVTMSQVLSAASAAMSNLGKTVPTAAGREWL